MPQQKNNLERTFYSGTDAEWAYLFWSVGRKNICKDQPQDEALLGGHSSKKLKKSNTVAN